MRIWISWSEMNLQAVSDPICLVSHKLQYEGDVRVVEKELLLHEGEQEQLRLPRPENQELRCHCGTRRLNCKKVQVIVRIGLNDVCSFVTQSVWLTLDSKLGC